MSKDINKWTSEWQKKISDTGEQWKKDSAEGTAIDFIMAQKRIGMPPERLNKLIYAITSILEQKKHDTINIRKECEGALQKLENEINKVEMAEARESCFRNKFGPGNAKWEGINGKKTAKYFQYLSTNQAEVNIFNTEITRNPELLAGFLRYWMLQETKGRVNPESNIIEILWTQNSAVLWMKWYYRDLLEHYKINISQRDNVADIQRKIKTAWETTWADSFGVLEKASNLMSEQEVKTKLWLSLNDSLETHGFSNKWVHGFSKGRWNFLISISEFEQELATTPDVKRINSKALANYFLYLESKGQLKPETLVQKFWGRILLQLGELWNKWGNKEEWGKDSLIAKKTLEAKNMGYIIDLIIKLSSPWDFLKKIELLNDTKEQGATILLLKEKYGLMQDKFKKEIKEKLQAKNPKLKDVEANTITEKILTEVLACEWVEGLVKMHRIIDKYNKEYGVKMDQKKTASDALSLQKTQEQIKIVESAMDLKNEKDLKKRKRLLEEQKRREQKLKSIQMAEKVNKQAWDSDIKDLISWKETISQVIEKISRKDADFAKQYKTWAEEKGAFEQKYPQKSTSNKEKLGANPSTNPSTDRSIPFNKINNGEPHTIRLDRHSENTDTVTIKRHDNLYMIQMGNDPENTTELPKEKVSAYIKSLQFMEKLGLGYFLRNLSQNELSNILTLSSKDTETVDNRDGNFDETEKKRILSSFGKILGVDGIDNINSTGGQKLFQWFFFTHPSIETILASKDIIRNGSLDSEILKKSLKTA